MSTVQSTAAVDIATTYNTGYTAQKKDTASKKADTAVTAKADEKAAVYEKSDKAATDAVSTKTPAYSKVANPDLVAKLKADVQAQVDNLQSIVSKLITGQGDAYGKANDIWKFLADGDLSTVSEAAKAQAQKDIAEGGYWSVDETANRILDFAKALVGEGASEEDIKKMSDAFEKGFKEATKAWGKDLPDISQQTYDKVMSGFNDWKTGGSEA